MGSPADFDEAKDLVEDVGVYDFTIKQVDNRNYLKANSILDDHFGFGSGSVPE